jgi:fatty acid-binding protein DegV
VHAAAGDEAVQVGERLASSPGANVVEGTVVEATPVIGAHTGPGLLGVAFYTE